MSIHDAYNFRRISDRLATAGQLTREQLQALKDHHVEVVINLLPESNKSAVPGEREIVEEQGIEYLYIPVDFAAPTIDDYRQFKEAMTQAGDRNLLIHCAANYRVSAFYSWYAVESGIWTPEEADAFIKGVWNPDDYPGWSELRAQLDADE